MKMFSNIVVRLKIVKANKQEIKKHNSSRTGDKIGSSV